MGRLGKLKLLVEIADTVNDIYNSYVERKRAKADDEKDRRIRELEAQLAATKREK
jgi:hypothetical protein